MPLYFTIANDVNISIRSICRLISCNLYVIRSVCCLMYFRCSRSFFMMMIYVMLNDYMRVSICRS